VTGHAVDLGAYIDGRLSWNWPPYLEIARAMRDASFELGIEVWWGGCWSSLQSGIDPAKQVEAYKARCVVAGKRPFLDGPHFEIV